MNCYRTPKPTDKGGKTSESNLGGDTSVSSMDKTPATARGETSRPPSPGPQTSLYDKDLLRMFAEVNFIQGEVSENEIFFLFVMSSCPLGRTFTQ